MRKIALFVFLLPFFMPLPCRAQHLRSVEVFGGYSYLRDGISSTVQPLVSCTAQPNVLPCPPLFGSDVGLNGWQASLTENTTSWFGVTEDLAGHYGNGTFQGLSYHFNEFSMLAGPRLSYPNLKPFTPFTHALFGYGQTRTSQGSAGPTTDGSFAFALGGGLDVNVARHVRIRLLEADYYRTAIFQGTQNSFRISAGVVLHFGR